MRAKVEPNDVSMSGLLVAAENSDDGRGGGEFHTDSKGVQLVIVCYITTELVEVLATGRLQ